MFWCSKEPSHLDGSFEYPQHMFWLRNKKNNFQLRTLIWGHDYIFKRDISNTMAFGNGLTNKDNIFMDQADTIWAVTRENLSFGFPT